MGREAKVFGEIVDLMSAAHADVEPGKMMSSEALKVGGKVFCFFRQGDEAMVFKLGKAAETERPELAGWQWLNPFKNRGPMKAWYQVPLAKKQHWQRLADEALDVVREGRE